MKKKKEELTALQTFVLICGLYVTFLFNWRLAVVFIVTLFYSNKTKECWGMKQLEGEK